MGQPTGAGGGTLSLPQLAALFAANAPTGGPQVANPSSNGQPTPGMFLPQAQATQSTLPPASTPPPYNALGGPVGVMREQGNPNAGFINWGQPQDRLMRFLPQSGPIQPTGTGMGGNVGSGPVGGTSGGKGGQPGPFSLPPAGGGGGAPAPHGDNFGGGATPTAPPTYGNPNIQNVPGYNGGQNNPAVITSNAQAVDAARANNPPMTGTPSFQPDGVPVGAWIPEGNWSPADWNPGGRARTLYEAGPQSQAYQDYIKTYDPYHGMYPMPPQGY